MVVSATVSDLSKDIPQEIQDALKPLVFNPETGESYIPVVVSKSPSLKIIVTPPRPSDALTKASIMNGKPVYMNLASAPYPHTVERAGKWLELRKEECDQELSQCLTRLKNLFEAETTEGLGNAVLPGCPVRSIRKIHPDGSDEYLGDISIKRATFHHIQDPLEAQRMMAENEARMVGDPEIVWAFASGSTK